MRKLICAGLCVLLLCCCGCSGMLEREYKSAEKHYEQYVEDDSSALVVRNYIGLKNALLYLVSEAQEYGVIRVYDYTGDVSEDLTELCLSIKRDTPIGAYAIDYTSHEKVTLVAYTELRVYITYRRTPEQIKGIESVSADLLRDALREALWSGQEYLALQLNYYANDRQYVADMFTELIQEMEPADLPDYTLTFYPETGVQHIVELSVSYPGGPEQFLRRAERIGVARRGLLLELDESMSDQEKYRTLAELLLARSEYDETADGDAYAAVVTRKANGRGFAEGYADLCRAAGLECIVVEGQRDGESWWWNLVKLEQGRYHVDLLSSGTAFRSDEEMLEFYVWDETYPVSGDSLEQTAPQLPEGAGEADGDEPPEEQTEQKR